MDEFDLLILRELEKDGRKPYSEVASKLKVSNTMIHQRINKMRNEGIIKKISLEVDEVKLGYEWSAFTGIELVTDSDAETIIQALEAIPEILECYYITGKYTLYVRIVAKSSAHMREIIYDSLDHIPGVLKTESIINFGKAFKRNIPI